MDSITRINADIFEKTDSLSNTWHRFKKMKIRYRPGGLRPPDPLRGASDSL